MKPFDIIRPATARIEPPKEPMTLEPSRARGADPFGPYVLSKELATTVNVALALDQPLLVTGEPGCGKTALAWAVAAQLGARFEPPATDPTHDEAGWHNAVAPIVAALDAARERLLVRHVLRWIGDGDDALIETYVRAIWGPLAQRRGERLVVGFDLRRLETAGMPLMKQWRVSRTERRVAQQIAHTLEQLEMPREGMCAALPELDSVSPGDLAQWLRAEARRRKDAADQEAAQLHSTTRGGRFDLVVERLAALNLDRRESP